MENVVTSSTDPGFGGWFDDPVIRMIQVERLKLQPCPTLFSESLAPSVSHLGDENNDLCQLLARDPSLCSIFDAESLLRVWGDQQMQQMKLEWNSIEALCSSEGGIMGLQSLKFKRLTSKYTFSLFYLILLVISPFCQKKKEQRGRCVSWLVISE